MDISDSESDSDTEFAGLTTREDYSCVPMGSYYGENIKRLKILKPKIFNKYWDELCTIETYCNDQFKNIAKTYKKSTPMIDIRDDRINQRGNKMR